MFTYTAREAAEAGLLFYRARYYNPSIGKFVSEDPIGPSITQDPGSLWRYAYNENKPIIYVDPFGLTKLSCDDLKKKIASNNKCSGVSGGTVLCMVLTESSGDPNARSGTGPSGLMQVGRRAAVQVGCEHSGLSDPDYNIQCGTKYLCWLMDHKGTGDLWKSIGYYGPQKPAGEYTEKVFRCLICLIKTGSCCDECNPNPH